MPLFINLDQTKEAILLFQQIPWVLLYSAGVVHWFLYQQPQHSSTHDCWQSHLHKANNQEIRILLIKCYQKKDSIEVRAYALPILYYETTVI